METCPTILLVDDDANDVLLFRYALERSPMNADLRIARSGLEAARYLSGYGVFSNRAEFPMPTIVLLDLAMPGVDGFQVLRWIRRHRSLSDLAVVVFTGSESGRAEAARYGADAYVLKSTEPGELLALLQQISLDWQERTEVPDLMFA
jgi:CheY-like chemotaxis protein